MSNTDNEFEIKDPLIEDDYDDDDDHDEHDEQLEQLEQLEQPTVNDKPKRQKKPKLSSKHENLLIFGHWVVSNSNIDNKQPLFDMFKINADLNEQNLFYNSFTDHIKDHKKVFKQSTNPKKDKKVILNNPIVNAALDTTTVSVPAPAPAPAPVPVPVPVPAPVSVPVPAPVSVPVPVSVPTTVSVPTNIKPKRTYNKKI